MADMEKDAREFDGQPFNGKTVATYLGYQAAAINVLALVMKEIIEYSEKVIQ